MRTLLAVLLMLPLACALGQGTTSCDDPAPWAALESLREKNAGTDAEGDVQFLINVRRFLCDEAEAGRLPWSEAWTLFELQRERIIREWRMSNPDAPPA